MTSVSRMEPLLPEDSKELDDLATDLVAKSSALPGARNPPCGPASDGGNLTFWISDAAGRHFEQARAEIEGH